MPILKSHNLLLDTERRILCISGTGEAEHSSEIPIAPLTWSVLAELLINSPNAISIEELNNKCWQNTVVSDETVVQRIALLRKILEKHGIPASAIENLRGQGYRWVPEVHTAESQYSHHTVSNSREKSKLLWLSTTLTILILFFLVFSFRSFYPGEKNPNIVTSQAEELLRQAHGYRQKFDAQSMSYAVSLYEKTLQLAPDNVSALAGLSMAKSHQISKFNHDPGDIQDTIDVAKRALALAPEDSFVLQANGLVQDIQGDIAGAIAFYEQALQLNPRETSLYGDLAYLHTINGAFAKAFDFHIKGLRGQQQFRQSQIALWFHLLRETTSSQYWYQQALLLNPHNLTDKLAYLDWMLKAGKFIEVFEFSAELQDLGIDDHRLLLIKAKAQALTGNYKEAQSTITESLVLHPHHAESLVWLQIINKKVHEVRNLDSAWQFYTELQYPWPQHYVQMALFAFNKQESDSENRVEISCRYLKLAVKNGYRDESWLKVLVDNGWLPDTPEVRQLQSNIALAVNAERKQLLENDEFQKLLNQTARAIVGN